MTACELAEFLRIPQSTINQLAREGTIPGVKIGAHWRFYRKAVEQWMGVSSEACTQLVHSEGVLARYGRKESFDISEQSQLIGKFDVRLNQLVTGQFRGGLEFVDTPNMMVYEQQWGRKSEVFGTAPEGYMVIGTSADKRPSELQWCGDILDHQRFGVTGPGGRVDYVMPDQTHNVALLIKPEILLRALGRPAYELLIRDPSIQFTPAAGARLVAAITGTIRNYAKRPELLKDLTEVSALESTLLDILISCLEHSSIEDQFHCSPTRRKYVRSAIDLVEGFDASPTALELARAVGVSQRTLNYAFREVLGVTPIRYLQLHRLNAAHRQLCKNGPRSASVTDIALKYGFGHAGRFSILHKQMFNEKPSMTLRRT